jgi:hypothetical protein
MWLLSYAESVVEVGRGNKRVIFCQSDSIKGVVLVSG